MFMQLFCSSKHTNILFKKNKLLYDCIKINMIGNYNIVLQLLCILCAVVLHTGPKLYCEYHATL